VHFGNDVRSYLLQLLSILESIFVVFS